MVVGRDKRTNWFGNQGKSVVTVSFGERTVDGHSFAAFFSGSSPFSTFTGTWAVNDHTFLRIYSELRKHFVAKPGFMDQLKIGVLNFFARARFSRTCRPVSNIGENFASNSVTLRIIWHRILPAIWHNRGWFSGFESAPNPTSARGG
jgi:hypothetical protein